MKECRFCPTQLEHVFADLKTSPPSNSYLPNEAAFASEVYFPLVLYVCDSCLLVQVDEEEKATNIFNEDYAYFSSFSTSWLAHCKKYTEDITDFLGLSSSSEIVEIASNDGYLLQYFKEKDFSVLGVEPTQSTADAAIEKGIPTDVRFFGVEYATERAASKKADLLIANNVIAHVPDINDFVGGMKIILADTGTITIEFPHLMRLVEENQFDTIYHEHFSYYSLHTIRNIFRKHGMDIYHVEELGTHGGSLRIYACHSDQFEIRHSVTELLITEEEKGMTALNYYQDFQNQIEQVKNSVVEFFNNAEGKKIAAYGAAAKGNTLLNYCGIKSDRIDFVVDVNPHKQGKFMPGSHIPIVSEEQLKVEQPDYVIILPWNLTTEISNQLSYTKEWGAQFVTFIPSTHIF